MQDTRAKKAPLHGNQPPIDSQPLPLICKRERSEDCALNCEADLEPISFLQSKRSKHNDSNNNDPNSSNNNANGSEDSTTTSQDPPAAAPKRTLLEFPLIDWIEPKENHHPPAPTTVCTFDAANLEKSVPPGYLKFISNLENEILNVSMERETLKIEVMRAQAMINVLQSRIDLLSKENEDLRRFA